MTEFDVLDVTRVSFDGQHPRMEVLSSPLQTNKLNGHVVQHLDCIETRASESHSECGPLDNFSVINSGNNRTSKL